MYAVELETDIREPFIKVPEYDRLLNRHVKVIFLVEESAGDPEFVSDGAESSPLSLAGSWVEDEEFDKAMGGNQWTRRSGGENPARHHAYVGYCRYEEK